MNEVLLTGQSLARIKAASQVRQLIEIMYESCLSIGADKFSYHFTPLFDSPTSNSARIFAKGFPQTWVVLYSTGHIRQSDPIPQAVMKHGRIMSWGEASPEAAHTDEEKRFFETAKQHGLEHGFGVPLWGPRGQNAYAAIGFPEEQDKSVEQDLLAEQIIMQTAHVKICHITAKDGVGIRLSKRETEILTWVAKGKSNTDIATILGISSETVATYMSRIFKKLGSSHRVGAAIRGLKLGLIDL